MAFEVASTNLVIEFGVILALLMGWQFTLAEFTGGPVMIVRLAPLFRLMLRERLVFLILAAALITRFVRTGGVAMLRMMGGSPQDHTDTRMSHTH